MPEPEGKGWLRACFVDLQGELCSLGVRPSRLERPIVIDGSAAESAVRVLEVDCVLDLEDAARFDVLGATWLLGKLRGPHGEPWPYDTRSELDRLERELGVVETWRGIAELEFYCLEADGRPVDDGGYFDHVGGRGAAIAFDAAEALEHAGVPILGIHHESGPGQWELDLGPLPPRALADAIVVAKTVVRSLAVATGARASFAARPMAAKPGSGLHLHQLLATASSAEEAGEASLGWFVGGLLEHAAGLCALVAPTVGSYRRLHAGPEAPSSAVWAHEHRGALVRVAHAVEGSPSVEYRGADPSANPYLAIAGVVVAGAHGVSSRREPGPAIDEDPEGFDPASPKAALTPLPRSLDEAIDALLADDVLIDAFDDRLVHRVVDAERATARRALALGRDLDASAER